MAGLPYPRDLFRQLFPPKALARVYPLLEDVVVHHWEEFPRRMSARVSDEFEVEMGPDWISCTCPEADGRRLRCLHKGAVEFAHWREAGRLDPDLLDAEHLRALAQLQLDLRGIPLARYLASLTREQLIEQTIMHSFETTTVGWPLHAEAARWAGDALDYADHLYAGVDRVTEGLEREGRWERVPPSLAMAHRVLDEAAREGDAMPLLPAVTLLVRRVRAAVDFSAPATAALRSFYRGCMELLETICSRGAMTVDECAQEILDLELPGRGSGELCPSLQWFVPRPDLADALGNRLDALSAQAVEELLAHTDIRTEVDDELCRRWNRLCRVTAEVAFSAGDLEELSRVLARWGEAPYGEFLRRAANRRAAAELLPISLAAHRAGRISPHGWTRQIRTAEVLLDPAEAYTGLTGGKPTSSHGTSSLRDASLSVLVGGLVEAGRRAEALDVLQQEFRRTPLPEAVPLVQTWWARIEADGDPAEWLREVMLGSEGTRRGTTSSN